MHTRDVLLRDFTGLQLRNLLNAAGLDELTDASIPLLGDGLGAAGRRRVSERPLWPSDVADDHTPVEFSIDFAGGEPPAVRVLFESIADEPGLASNLEAALQVLHAFTKRAGLSLQRFEAVRDLFLPERPRGAFTLWYSLVCRHGQRPAIKAYFNPQVTGPEAAPWRVCEALGRLGFSRAYPAIADHALRRGDRDQFSFFALDLDGAARARVKVYISHHSAHIADAQWAATAVPGITAGDVEVFCRLAGGGREIFAGRPLVSSYTFLAGDRDLPCGYSLYVPIRGYVAHDNDARLRVLDILAHWGIDAAPFDRALTAVAHRPLTQGAGLIAHVSLRMGSPRPGVTAYLSSEAYAGARARSMIVGGRERETWS